MTKGKTEKAINVQGLVVNIARVNQDDYISLTDMARYKDTMQTNIVISHWMSTRYTVKYLGIWERLNNPDFKDTDFGIFKEQAGDNGFILTPKRWAKELNGIGVYSKAGRYGGGTFAHRDIAFEFASWLSPEFKYYLVREFQRLKSEEQQRLSLEWNLQRTLAKINYRIHTDAIKEQIIPPEVTKEQANFIYAFEADLLNVALFGKTAGQWCAENQDAEGNIRDNATLEQLVVLSNLESLNAVFIRQGLSQSERLITLNQTAIMQLTSLLANEHIKRLSAGSAQRL
jgi:hypothetical protein